MNLALVFAIIAPIVWGFLNTFDKFVISHKVKNVLGFAVWVGVANIIISFLIALFLNWSGVTLISLVFPACAGIVFGVQAILYYKALNKSDVSHLIGLYYVYPVFVSALSFIFLKEVVSFLGYIGVFLVISGSVALSFRVKNLKAKMDYGLLFGIIITGALGEFFIKLTTENLSAFQGLVVNDVFLGLIMVLYLFSGKIRREFVIERRNIIFAFSSELLTMLGMMFVYLAMNGLAATIVSSVGASQPLFVILFERIAQGRYGKMTKDILLLPKLGAIVLVVIGVVLLVISTQR